MAEKPEKQPAEEQRAEPRLTREKVELALKQWQRETKEMAESLSGVFELSDDAATTPLK
jgi:hypothetical protein